MPSITELPTELVEQIISYLDQPALYALSQVSKSTYSIVLPVLYRHVDLLIPPGKVIPQIDIFLANILERPLADYVRTLRVGLSPEEGTSDGQRFLPGENDVGRLGFQRAMELMKDQPLISNGDDLLEAFKARDYGAYAAMLLLTLPSLSRLEVHDHRNETLRPFHNILEHVHDRVGKEPLRRSKAADRISAIEEIFLNCDSKSGHQHQLGTEEVKVWQAWKLPGVRKLEFIIPHTRSHNIWAQHWRQLSFRVGDNKIEPTRITNLVIRHSSRITECLRNMLAGTHQLRSLTCELWHDAAQSEEGGNAPSFSLNEWNNALLLVQETLQTLVLSVEFCDSQHPFFKQPKVTGQITGSLDLRLFKTLETLECPVPFISGDYTFFVALPIDSRLPSGLRHLTLRTDISHAQFPYPFEQSILPAGPSLSDAREEANHLMNARMDVSYLASASISLVDQLDHLASISVWQPPDPSHDMFEGQLNDLAVTCKNKGMVAKALYPLLLRWNSAAHWNLVKEVTLFDPLYPKSERIPKLFRGERDSVPLGLASQYHLAEFKRRHIKKSRR